MNSHCVTGHLEGPVKENRFWNLTGNDRTLEAERPVSLCAVSGQQMTVEIK